MAIFTYDPKQFTLIIGGHIATGFSDDDFIELERDEDAWMKKVGVDGEVTRAKSNNQSGHIIIRLMQSSATNDVLSAFAVLDENANTGAVPVLAKDSTGRSAFSTDFAWVKKFPKTTWKKGVAFWEWTLDCGNLTTFIGGN